MTPDRRTQTEYLARVERRIAERKARPDHARDYYRAESERIARKYATETTHARAIGDLLPWMR